MVMRRLFESPRVADVPNLMVRANQYRSAFEPEEFALTPLATAAIFGQHRVVEALLADPEVKVSYRDTVIVVLQQGIWSMTLDVAGQLSVKISLISIGLRC